MNNTLKLLIFDMDGLMIDTERLSEKSWKAAAKEHGYDIPQSVFNRIIGRDNRRIPEIFTEVLGEDYPYDLIYQEKCVRSAAYVKEHGVPVKEGLKECLDFAAAQQLKMAVASSTRHDRVCSYLEQIGILDCFQLIQSGEDIPRGKPNPDVFLLVCEKMGVDPGQAVVLEDSTNGLLAAKAAGIRSIWIPDLCVVPDEVIKTVWKQGETLADVPGMLQEII